MFNLQLTNVGKSWLTKLALQQTPVTFSVAIGDGSTPPDKNDTQLKNHKMWADDAEVEKILIDNTFHITASFINNNIVNDFEIKEIGVFVQGNSISEKILLGRYASESTLAIKSSGIDLLIDTILDFKNYSSESLTLDSSQYKPKFNNNYASYNTPGTVRFASEEDILNMKKGLAISSEILNTPGILTKRALRDNWSEFDTEEIHNQVDCSNGKISSLYFDGRDEICCLLFLNESNVLFLTFNIFDNKFKIEKKVIGFSNEKLLDIPDLYLYKKTNKIIFFGFIKNYSSVYEFIFKVNDKSIISSMKGGSKDTNPLGTLSIYNNSPISVGGAKSADERITSYDGKINKLKIPRKLPLIHTIQDKIYCLGGEDSKEEQSLEILQPINHTTYVNLIPNTINLTDSANLISAILGYKIFIFHKKNFFEKNLEFYSYDYLSGYWEVHRLRHTIKFSHTEKLSIKCVAANNAIYLCFCQPNNSSLKLTMLQYIPT